MKTKPKQKLGPNQKRWIKALRSGKFTQGKEKLHSLDGAMCCLGVACNIFGMKPKKVAEKGKTYRL